MEELIRKLEDNIKEFLGITEEAGDFLDKVENPKYYALSKHTEVAVEGLTSTLLYLRSVQRGIEIHQKEVIR